MLLFCSIIRFWGQIESYYFTDHVYRYIFTI